MTKMRVYELARDMNVESKLLLARLKGFGIDASHAQSTLTDEQIQKIRASFASRDEGKAEASAAHSSSGPTNDNSTKPTVVIRRRKKASEEIGSNSEQVPEIEGTAAQLQMQAEPSSVDQSTLAGPELSSDSTEEVAPAAVSRPTAEAAPSTAIVNEQTATPMPKVPASEVSASRPLPNTQKGVEVREEFAPRVVTKEQELPSSSKASEIPQGSGMNRPQVPAPARSTGATIVRRATPEEMAASAKAAAKASTEKENTGAFMRRRPMRPEGSPPAPSSFRSPFPPRGDSTPKFVPLEELLPSADQTSRSLDKKKDRTRADDEEEMAARHKAAALRAKGKGIVSTRALLSQLEDGDDENQGDGDTAIATPTPQDLRGRTVYTPNLAAKRRDLKRRKDLKKTQITTPRAKYRIVEMGSAIQVGELARQMAVKAAELIKKLMAQGMMVTITDSIDLDTATLLASELGFEVKNTEKTIHDILGSEKPQDSELVALPRPPIVTVMGHVDHGKTSILDAIRSTDVASGEAGGITQHIGAYTVSHHGKTLAFLDTPGHEAFSQMRARGAQLTDIVVLVVAADDGVMPQTREAVSHAKDAGVPLIVAINKIDKPNTNFDRIYNELSELAIVSEEWGGDTQFVRVSALEKRGIDELLEAILLQAEVLELRSSPEGLATGTVVEAHLDKGRGPVATVMVRTGTLKAGDYVVVGCEHGRIRAMYDHHGARLDEAGPSTPVAVLGLASVPAAGDELNAVDDERTAREAADWRRSRLTKGVVKSRPAGTTSLDELLGKIKSEEIPTVNVVLKADTQGSLEAITEALTRLSTDRVSTRIVHRGVGGVTESDVALAQTSAAMLIGFNVRANRALAESAEDQGVPISYYSIIYELMDAVKSVMAGKLPPIRNEVIQGHAEVRSPISVPKVGIVAGSAVTDGKITRNCHLRLIRDNIVIFNGKIGGLRRFKDDVREVASGYECGISIEGFTDVRIGDVIEAFIIEERAATL